jgi:hypothetical protein
MTMAAFPDHDDPHLDPDHFDDDEPSIPDFPLYVTPSSYRRIADILDESSEQILTHAEFHADIHGPSRWGVLALSLPSVPLIGGLFVGPQHREWLQQLPLHPWTLSFNTRPEQNWIACHVHVPTVALTPLLTAFTADPRHADDLDLMAEAIVYLRQRLAQQWPAMPMLLIGFHRTPFMQRIERLDHFDPPADAT